MKDDGEIELNLPWEDSRELMGATASGTTVEHYRLEPPNGARLKWSRHKLSVQDMEEPRDLAKGTTANQGGPVMDRGGMGVPAPILPTFQQYRQNAGAATPMRVDAKGAGVSRSQDG